MYLFTYIVPITGMMITGRLEVPGDFADTAHRIIGSELFIASDSPASSSPVCAVSF